MENKTVKIFKLGRRDNNKGKRIGKLFLLIQLSASFLTNQIAFEIQDKKQGDRPLGTEQVKTRLQDKTLVASPESNFSDLLSSRIRNKWIF